MKVGQNPFPIPPPATNTANKNIPAIRMGTDQEIAETKKRPREDNADISSTFQSLNAWDNSYSKEDALAAQWHKENGWSEDGNLLRLGFSRDNATELNAYLEQLRKKEGFGDTSIDWRYLESDLRGISNSDAGNLESKVDYLASRYAVLREKIGSNYSGKEQENQLNKLEEVFQTSLTTMAKNYSNELGMFFEENGVSGETQKIYDSIISGVKGKANEYSKYMETNKNYAGLKNSPDQWLANDDEYMASKLRESTSEIPISESKNNKQEEMYSISDLDVSSKIMQQLEWHGGGLESGNFINSDEESTGLDLAVLAMKVDTLAKNKGVGSKMSSLIQKAMNGYVDNYLDKINNDLSDNRNHPLITGDKRGFAPFSKEDVYSVYSKAIISYQETGDFMKAILSGAEYGKNQFNQKISSGEFEGIYRYEGSSGSTWNSFYSADSSRSFQQVYENSTSTLQKYRNNWEAFASSLNGNTKDINLYLSSSGLSLDREVHMTVFKPYWEAHA